jgi:short subunit dehydrogenase-like uncharacterized protein
VNAKLLIYGATGYSGELITRQALRAQLQPIVAGRGAAAVRALAAAHDLPARVFTLEGDVQQELDGVRVVLNCAGPFAHTWSPLVHACIARGVHYIDITGEIAVFTAIADLDESARAAGVMLLPGAGYDVVPTDCLAAHVAARLPGAERLLLGVSSSGRLSRGTATTVLENAAGGGWVRRGGRIASVPAAWRTRRIDFGTGARLAVTIPWGDVATAWYSTRIPDIEVYAAVSPGMLAGLYAMRGLGWLARRRVVHDALLRRIRAAPAGPSEQELASGRSVLWARAESGAGRFAEARVYAPNGYALTAHTAVLAAQRALAGDAPPGFQTPSKAYGADFILEVPGTRREDVA